MNDKIQIKEDDMVDGVAAVTRMADVYSESISVLQSTLDMVDGAFEDVGNAPRESWEEFRDLLWTCLADSQDSISQSAQDLVDYTNEMFAVDGENAEELSAAGEIEDAKRPEGD